jgi:hypothetical protein
MLDGQEILASLLSNSDLCSISGHCKVSLKNLLVRKPVKIPRKFVNFELPLNLNGTG